MNILVKTFGGHIVARPDTSWEKDNEDFYPQDFVHSLSYTPVLFAKVSKPGRSVSAKFAYRYWQEYGFGVLLYPDDLQDGSPEGFAQASCLDHSSFLPDALMDKSLLPQARFALAKDAEELFICTGRLSEEMDKAIEEVTARIYIRIGDIIAIELAPAAPLMSAKEASCRVTGSYKGKSDIDFKILK